jgi:hypothetical protein
MSDDGGRSFFGRRIGFEWRSGVRVGSVPPLMECEDLVRLLLEKRQKRFILAHFYFLCIHSFMVLHFHIRLGENNWWLPAGGLHYVDMNYGSKLDRRGNQTNQTNTKSASQCKLQSKVNQSYICEYSQCALTEFSYPHLCSIALRPLTVKRQCKERRSKSLSSRRGSRPCR